MEENKIEKSEQQIKGEEKAKKVKEFCDSLKVGVFAKLISDENGIRPVVVVSDNENYEEESKSA